IFCRGLRGALFASNTNKTNNKQHVNRGYDSESGTTILRTRPKGGFLLFCDRTLHRTPFDYSPHGSLILQDIGWKLTYQKLYPKQHAKSGQNDDT
ncbi:hypothetical protein FMJ35_31870, partial [Klebsiella michiganensis]|nr:hypothetical protein [Klebsiella michiganensis]